MELPNNKKLTPSEVIARIRQDVSILIAHHETTHHPEHLNRRHKKTPRDT
jgi:hypothetical protein